jgi:formate--tetrahydrofolate ligase
VARIEPFFECLLGLGADTFAVESAHNLLASALEDVLHRGGDVDPSTVSWRRVLDMDDRSLRQVRVGLGKGNGPERDAGFDITAASEVMAILALSSDLVDLRARLAAIVVARDAAGRPITAGDVGAAGAMGMLLRDAFAPNLLQSSEGTPVLVHTGPFGNIAPGCSSVVADRLALARAQYVVTEAGFGSELGAEKFMHLKAPLLGVAPDAAVLVAPIGCLREQGGGGIDTPDPRAVRAGCANLRRHLGNLATFGIPTVVAVNRFPDDSDEEFDVLAAEAKAAGATAAVVHEAFVAGGRGCEALAGAVVAAASTPSTFTPLVARDAPVTDKVGEIARHLYGAGGVDWSPTARRELEWLDAHGYGRLPVCMAKTQHSLSDDPTLRGAPSGFTLTVSSLRLAAGAGYVTVLSGDIATMPGFPSQARFREMDIDADGVITGLV